MKSWDKMWESMYQKGYGARYPNEELVRFISRLFKNLKKEKKSVKILEVGCGSGANVWYLAREGFSVYGIDGSETAINVCAERLKKEGLKAEIKIGDMSTLPYSDKYFDVVIDIASIQHNTPDEIKKIIAEIYRVMKAGGSFFSFTRSDKDYLFGHGWKIAENTFTDIPIGDAKGVGKMHFFTVPEIKELLAKTGFKEFNVEYTERTVENMSYIIAHYIVTARKG